jgi:glycosyltransferase involved in cell wall biosynthesis
MPRVMHTTTLINVNAGGVGAAVIGVAAAQHSLGLRVRVRCLDSRSAAELVRPTPDLEIETNRPLIRPPVAYSPRMESWSRSSDAERIEILHQHSLWSGLSRVTRAWRKRWKKPTVIAAHGCLLEHSLARPSWKKRLALHLYERSNLHEASCLHATTEQEVESYRRFGCVQPIALIPNGVSDQWLESDGDPERFHNTHGIPRQRILLFLGRIHPVKGLPLLIQAMGSGRKRLGDWHLVIAGPGEDRHRRVILDLIQRLDLGDRVSVIGALGGQAKRDAFSAADLFVLPSHSESFGITIAEALAVGVPVITTRATPWQIVADQRCGWWVEVHSEALLSAMNEADRLDPQELAMMGSRGKPLVRDRFTWSAAAEATLLLYQWLRDGGPPPRFLDF